MLRDIPSAVARRAAREVLTMGDSAQIRTYLVKVLGGIESSR
jgi:hypothetical protein